MGTSGAVLVASSPDRPVQAVGPVSLGRWDGCAARQPQQLRDGERASPSDGTLSRVVPALLAFSERQPRRLVGRARRRSRARTVAGTLAAPAGARQPGVLVTSGDFFMATDNWCRLPRGRRSPGRCIGRAAIGSHGHPRLNVTSCDWSCSWRMRADPPIWRWQCPAGMNGGAMPNGRYRAAFSQPATAMPFADHRHSVNAPNSFPSGPAARASEYRRRFAQHRGRGLDQQCHGASRDIRVDELFHGLLLGHRPPCDLGLLLGEEHVGVVAAVREEEIGNLVTVVAPGEVLV
jgi:hypothetical protein